PLGRLTAIPGRPPAAIDLAQDVLCRDRTILDFDVLEHLVSEAELSGKHVHDIVVILALEDRFDDLLAPLQRAVGGGARSFPLKTGMAGKDMGVFFALG